MSVIGIATTHHPEDEVVLEDQMGTSPPEADRKVVGSLAYGGTKPQALGHVDREEAVRFHQKIPSTEEGQNASRSGDRTSKNG